MNKEIRGIALRDQHFAAHEVAANHGPQRLHPLIRTKRPKQRKIFGPVFPTSDRISPFIHDTRFDCWVHAIAGQRWPRALWDLTAPTANRRCLRTGRCRGRANRLNEPPPHP